jgi:hypothetical protein
MDGLYIRKVKRGKGDGLWGSYPVDEDEHGLWLYTPQHSLYRGTNQGAVAYCHAGQPDPPGLPVIHLIPANGWWFARWQADHVAIDICTPSVLVGGGTPGVGGSGGGTPGVGGSGGGTPGVGGSHGNVWSYDDLELDLHKRLDGRWGVTDEDEFLEAHFEGHIDADEVRMSLETAGTLRARLAAGDHLFDVEGWRRLAECTERPFEPLVTFPPV